MKLLTKMNRSTAQINSNLKRLDLCLTTGSMVFFLIEFTTSKQTEIKWESDARIYMTKSNLQAAFSFFHHLDML